MKKLLLLSLLMLSSTVYSSPPFEPNLVIYNWDIPTTRTNGDILLADDLWGYEIVNDCNDKIIEIVGSQNKSITRPIIDVVNCNYQIRVVDINGIRSSLSNIATLDGRPSPVLKFTITLTIDITE